MAEGLLIREPITGGRGQISGSFDVRGAKFADNAILKVVRPDVAEFEPIGWNFLEYGSAAGQRSPGERGQRAMAPLQQPAPAATPNAAAPSKET